MPVWPLESNPIILAPPLQKRLFQIGGRVGLQWKEWGLSPGIFRDQQNLWGSFSESKLTKGCFSWEYIPSPPNLVGSFAQMHHNGHANNGGWLLSLFVSRWRLAGTILCRDPVGGLCTKWIPINLFGGIKVYFVLIQECLTYQIWRIWVSVMITDPIYCIIWGASLEFLRTLLCVYRIPWSRPPSHALFIQPAHISRRCTPQTLNFSPVGKHSRPKFVQ